MSRRGSSIGRTKVAQMMGGTFARQREHDEKIAKMKSINEVEALRGVFYSFFEAGKVNSGDGDDSTNKILISMQVGEHQLNPFFEEEELDM